MGITLIKFIYEKRPRSLGLIVLLQLAPIGKPGSFDSERWWLLFLIEQRFLPMIPAPQKCSGSNFEYALAPNMFEEFDRIIVNVFAAPSEISFQPINLPSPFRNFDPT